MPGAFSASELNEKTPVARGFAGWKSLDERLCGFDGALYDVAGFVDRVFYVASRALDCLFGLFAETLGLLLEIVGRVFEVISCVFNSLAKLLAGFGAGLWGIEEGD
jgi:hypothetical protein